MVSRSLDCRRPLRRREVAHRAKTEAVEIEKVERAWVQDKTYLVPGVSHQKYKMAAENTGPNKAPKQLKLVVFGGTGLTGKEIVKQALERGHLVTAVVRTPEKVETR